MSLPLPTHHSSLAWAELPIVALPFTTAGADRDAPLLDLDATLSSGQAFRWRQASAAWIGVVGDQVVRIWTEPTGAIRAQMYPVGALLAAPSGRVPRTRAQQAAPLHDYFRADLDLRAWATVAVHQHPLLAAAIGRFLGLRVLGQDSTEVLLSFAGATARSVELIARSIEILAGHFGRPIAEIDGVHYHAFPTPPALAAAPLDELARGCRLFYRAATVQRVARILVERGEDWLPGLARRPFAEVHAELAAIPGIGPKVADCVCLFGLRFDEAVPIDAHVWRLAQLVFPGEIPTRTLTPRTYAIVAGLFRRRFGRMAGWAQQYLFHARRTPH